MAGGAPERLRPQWPRKIRLTSEEPRSVGRAALEDGAPRLEHIAPVGHAERQLHVLLDEDHRDAALAVDRGEDVARSARPPRGASPRKGSSTMSSAGRAMRPRPMATICCSPPESVCASWPAARAEQREERLDVGQRFPPRRCLASALIGAEQEVLAHGQVGEEPAALEHVGEAEPDDAVGWQAGRCAARGRQISPLRARTRPESVFMSVDLPAPFGPSIATTSPRTARGIGRPRESGSRRTARRGRGPRARRRPAVSGHRPGPDRPRSRGGRAPPPAGGPSAMTSPRWSATMRCEMSMITPHVVLDDDQRRCPRH